MRSDRAWERFLAEQDLVWRRLPRTWYEGPFLGNGFLGSMVYQEPGRNALRFTINHSEVQDHRPTFGNERGVARLPVGNLILTPVGEITAVNLRLDLWNAELRGTITTTAGRLGLRAYIESARSLLAVSLRPTGDERAATLEFHPAKALSPRTVREDPPANFTLNPDPVARTENDHKLVTKAMVAGGQTATAYAERRGRDERTLYLTVAHSYPDTTAEQQVLDTIRHAPHLDRLTGEHRDWWHRFYRESFISLPDGLLQSFYWIQLYKVASAARAAAPIMATTGPWLEQTPWPSCWFNLMIQFYDCHNVLISDVTIVEPAMWTVHPVLCTNVTVRGITVVSTLFNTDGCDPESCTNVLISGCRFNTNDDCVAVKSGRDEDGHRVGVPSQNILVEDCLFSGRWGGITVGSEMSGGVRNVFAQRCVINSPDFPGNFPVKYPLYVKTNKLRGGFIEDVHLRHFTGGAVEREAIFINMAYNNQIGTRPVVVRNISVDKMTIDGARAVLNLVGLETDDMSRIRLSNSTFTKVANPNAVQFVDDLSLTKVMINGRPAQ